LNHLSIQRSFNNFLEKSVGLHKNKSLYKAFQECILSVHGSKNSYPVGARPVTRWPQGGEPPLKNFSLPSEKMCWT